MWYFLPERAHYPSRTSTRSRLVFLQQLFSPRPRRLINQGPRLLFSPRIRLHRCGDLIL